MQQLKLLKKKIFLEVFMLGIAGGMPIVLLASTLSIWLTELGVSKTSIGLFSLTMTPYVLKFLWSPLVDGYRLPFFKKTIGKRRSWLIFSQILLFATLSLLAFSQPEHNLFLTALATILVAFASATQDIVIDAQRVENLATDEQAMGATLYVYGYRIGMLFSGAGVLLLAEYWGFPLIYFLVALLYLAAAFLLGSFITDKQSFAKEKIHYLAWFRNYVISPFKDFLARDQALLIICFIVIFKLADAFAGLMTNPFLLELGFSKVDIAYYVKTVGMVATILGSFLGGLLSLKFSLKNSLYVAAILQILTNLIFCIQALLGKNALFLSFTIFAENLAGGIGTIVLVAYLGSLCNVKFTATQYALLTSLAAVGRTWISAGSGYLADQVNWVEFFLASGIIGLPALLLLKYLPSTNVTKNN